MGCGKGAHGAFAWGTQGRDRGVVRRYNSLARTRGGSVGKRTGGRRHLPSGGEAEEEAAPGCTRAGGAAATDAGAGRRTGGKRRFEEAEPEAAADPEEELAAAARREAADPAAVELRAVRAPCPQLASAHAQCCSTSWQAVRACSRVVGGCVHQNSEWTGKFIATTRLVLGAADLAAGGVLAWALLRVRDTLMRCVWRAQGYAAVEAANLARTRTRGGDGAGSGRRAKRRACSEPERDAVPGPEPVQEPGPGEPLDEELAEAARREADDPAFEELHAVRASCPRDSPAPHAHAAQPVCQDAAVLSLHCQGH